MSEQAGPAGRMRGAQFAGCSGMCRAWAGRAQWRILDLGTGPGLREFLATWAAWREDDARPRLLHYVACTAQPLDSQEVVRAARPDAPAQALARQLAEHLWGLLPGVHRVSLEDGRVLLTLLVGDTQRLLRQQRPVADTVFWAGHDPGLDPAGPAGRISIDALKARMMLKPLRRPTCPICPTGRAMAAATCCPTMVNGGARRRHIPLARPTAMTATSTPPSWRAARNRCSSFCTARRCSCACLKTTAPRCTF